MSDKSLQGKTAYVSGGTGGIGFFVARMLAGSGCNLLVTGRNEERGAEAVRELEALGAKAVYAQGDAGEYQSCKRAVEAGVKAFGGIDIIISCGAEGRLGPKLFAEMSEDDIRSSFEDRFYPRIFPVHAGVDELKKSKGSAVFITTDAARHVTSGESVIGAFGAAVVLMTKGLARELSRDQVRINAVAMTLTSDTPAWDRIFSKEDLGTQVFRKALERFPFGRAPNAEEVSKVILFLASDDASQITGQTLSVNGGLSFGGW